MITLQDVREAARPLPRTEEHLIRDYIKFKVGRIVYASVSPDETTLGFAFPKDERESLIASSPDKFQLPRASDMRYNWVHLRMSAVTKQELQELILDAWQMAVPRSVAVEYLDSRLPGPDVPGGPGRRRSVGGRKPHSGPTDDRPGARPGA